MVEPDRLEELLRLAATDPGHRPEFYAALLQADVFVLEAAAAPHGPGAALHLQEWEREGGGRALPFFTSLTALRRAADADTPYAQLPARSLFEAARGATLVLNPRSPFGKEFVPAEVERLLRGELPAHREHHVVQAPRRVVVGQPLHYPDALVQALNTLFAKLPQVRAAWLALMSGATEDGRPRLLVGVDLEGDGDAERVLAQAGGVGADALGPGEELDVVRVRAGDAGGVSAYLLKETQPFYRRAVHGTRVAAASPFH